MHGAVTLTWYLPARLALAFMDRSPEQVLVLVEQRQHRIHGGMAQLAHRAGAHELADVAQRGDVGFLTLAIRDPGQDVGRDARPHAAGNALPHDSPWTTSM